MNRIDRCCAGAVLLIAAPQAFAYLDPGTGSMIIQGLIAAIAMAGVTMRLYWNRLKQFLGIDKHDEAAAGSSDPESGPETLKKARHVNGNDGS
jgi:hypothetical protein